LIVATIVAFVLGEHLEAAAILIVILTNAVIGFLTELKSEQTLLALQKQSVTFAHVVREGLEQEIPAAQLVPGDIVILAAGSRVPADGRVTESIQLHIEEAALTGESNAVHKSTEKITDINIPLADRINMVFMGTTITDGRGRALVVATAANTELGKIGTLINLARKESTPLEQKLAQLGRLLILIVFVLCAVIVLIGWLKGTADFWHLLRIGISLAIAAVPEGLPTVATLCLALGMKRMASKGALIRRLPAVETLGSTTIICSDKTGTLTRNEMTVSEYALSSQVIKVSGTGYNPVGDFSIENKIISPLLNTHLKLALQIGLLCNDAKLVMTNNLFSVLGDPTEGALVVAAMKGGLQPTDLASEYRRVKELPFDSTSKRMITVHQDNSGNFVAYIKGSPGTLIAASAYKFNEDVVSTMTDQDRHNFEEINLVLAGSALRVLALAYRDLPADFKDSDLEKDLVFVGLVGMIDPLRDEAKAAISTCRDAGIKTIMITGDQQATAVEIARQLEIDRGLGGEMLKVVHGRDLIGLDAEGWQRAVSDTSAFARASPEHKLKIVEALQKQGHVVAMTGDGVNDAPALKKANIGIAMGRKGSEVAKEISDMVITDDNFATIVGAVEQGRIIYANILRFIHYLFSCNFAEILTVFIALMIGWPVPLSALQILWLNVITDVFPALALALEPSAPGMMKRGPRDPNESILAADMIILIAWQGLMLATVTLLAFYIGTSWYGASSAGQQHASSIAFMTLALSQVFHSFNARSRTRSIFDRQLFMNLWLWSAVLLCLLLQIASSYLPPLQRVLHTIAHSRSDWLLIAFCSLLPVGIVELMKLLQRIKTPTNQ
jgi:Ca2+-transporting ATPase